MDKTVSIPLIILTSSVGFTWGMVVMLLIVLYSEGKLW